MCSKERKEKKRREREGEKMEEEEEEEGQGNRRGTERGGGKKGRVTCQKDTGGNLKELSVANPGTI